MFKQNIMCQEGESLILNDRIKITVTKIEGNRVHITIYITEREVGEGNITAANEDQPFVINTDHIEVVVTKVITRNVHSNKAVTADILLEHEALHDKLN